MQYFNLLTTIKLRSFVLFLFLLLLHTFNSWSQVHKRNTGINLVSLNKVIDSNIYPNINSILISSDDRLMYSHYFSGYTSDSLHDTRSSFKSITSLLIGIAIDKGLIKNTNQKIFSFFPEYKNLFYDKRKKEITIQDLLDMESGFNCEEFNNTRDCEEEMSVTNNWVKFSLSVPMKNKPGKVWSYTSCNPMILSGVISKVAHMSVMEFAKRNLFDPLGVINYKWTVDPSGNGMTAGSFFISPLDMLKIGQLVSNLGNWKGRQVISKRWINTIMTSKIPIPGFSFVKLSRNTKALPQQTYYGDYWYKEKLVTPRSKENLLFASGNGGQYIFIIKRLKLVVVFTQSNYGSWRAKQAFDILLKYILPAFD